MSDFLSQVNIFKYFYFLKSKMKKELTDYKKYMELQKIMNERAITTFFQPIIDLQREAITGYEVLNRPPVSDLFPTTEKFYDFIGNTDQVFSFECFSRTISLHRFFDCLIDEPKQKNSLIFLNIQPQVLLDSNYRSGETLQQLEKLQLSPKQIVFELTEKSAVSDFAQFERVLSHYRSQGFRIAIDDAGSGYNSLKSLVHLKPEFIKIDRSLISYIDENIEQQQMVNLLLEFSNQSNTHVIAEGIERMEELIYLREKGVHYGQGYAIGRPEKALKANVPANISRT